MQVPFLDLASAFRKVDLSRLDLDSDEALCFFGNLYHLLVRHMLLVLGAPSSAKVRRLFSGTPGDEGGFTPACATRLVLVRRTLVCSCWFMVQVFFWSVRCAVPRNPN